MTEGMIPETRIPVMVQRFGYLESLALTERRNQTQHRGCRDPRDRSAKGHPQSLNRCGQTLANRREFSTALKGQRRASKGGDHAHKRAHQAEHDQQPYQIGRQDRRRQPLKLPHNALVHGVT